MNVIETSAVRSILASGGVGIAATFCENLSNRGELRDLYCPPPLDFDDESCVTSRSCSIAYTAAILERVRFCIRSVAHCASKLKMVGIVCAPKSADFSTEVVFNQCSQIDPVGASRDFGVSR